MPGPTNNHHKRTMHGYQTVRLNREEELDLWRKAKGGDGEAKDLLAKSLWGLSLRLSHNAAKRQGWGDQYDTVRSTAGLALTKAIDQFDPSTSCRISTLLGWKVVGEAFQVRRTFDRQQDSLLNRSKYNRGYVLSIDTMASEDDNGNYHPLFDEVCAPDDFHIYDDIHERDELLKIHWAMSRLERRGAVIMYCLFFCGWNLPECADLFGVTRQRIYQLKQKYQSHLDRLVKTAPSSEMMYDADGHPLDDSFPSSYDEEGSFLPGWLIRMLGKDSREYKVLAGLAENERISHDNTSCHEAACRQPPEACQGSIDRSHLAGTAG